MSFTWMNETVGRSAARNQQSHRAQIEKELGQRAAMYYRLRFSKERALQRLRDNVAWDFEVAGTGRPAWLDDSAIEQIVDTTYKRRPSQEQPG